MTTILAEWLQSQNFHSPLTQVPTQNMVLIHTVVSQNKVLKKIDNRFQSASPKQNKTALTDKN